MYNFSPQEFNKFDPIKPVDRSKRIDELYLKRSISTKKEVELIDEEILFNLFKINFKRIARKYYSIDVDDLYSLFFKIYLECMEIYDPAKSYNPSFSSFYHLVLTRKVISVLTNKENRNDKKNVSINSNFDMLNSTDANELCDILIADHSREIYFKKQENKYLMEEFEIYKHNLWNSFVEKTEQRYYEKSLVCPNIDVEFFTEYFKQVFILRKNASQILYFVEDFSETKQPVDFSRLKNQLKEICPNETKLNFDKIDPKFHPFIIEKVRQKLMNWNKIPKQIWVRKFDINDYKLVFSKYFFEFKSYVEIADEMGATAKSIDKKIVKIKEIMPELPRMLNTGKSSRADKQQAERKKNKAQKKELEELKEELNFEEEIEFEKTYWKSKSYNYKPYFRD